MSTLQKTFYYNEQLKKVLIQVMAVFADMRVQVGWTEDKQPRLVKVPVYAASKDRVVAAIKGENTQNKMLSLPSMSVQLASLDLAPDLRKGSRQERRQTYLPEGGLFPEDLKVVQQRMPNPYRASFNLHIWASNQDQHYQMLEQILSIFDPILQIQTSDDVFDWTQIKTLELVGMGMEENFPAGGDRRIIQTTLTFVTQIYLSIPSDVHDKFVKDIYLRVGTIASAFKTKNSYDVVAELDSQGVDYNLHFSLDDVDIPPE